MARYPRDMTGYGDAPPRVVWPGAANIAVQFVLNYEEGGENNTLHGDKASEAFLSEIVGAEPWPGRRHWNMESIYEYGARRGFWRLHKLLAGAGIPVTVFGVATALARGPEQVGAMREAGWEIASHGYKWIDYGGFTRQREAAHIADAIALHTEVTGARPEGWYTGRCSTNTVDLVTEAGGFAYVADSYADDLPYWHVHKQTPQLVVPYTLDANDMRFASPQGFNSGDQFLAYLKDSFEALYREGEEGAPKIMSIGLHCRLAGRPGRIESLKRFIDHVKARKGVWCARRVDIARHWHRHHPFDMEAWRSRPSAMGKAAFVKRFADVFEHSPWVAEGAHKLELGPAFDTARGLHNAFCRVFRAAGRGKRMAVLRAHPDLAGKLAAARKLTPRSAGEQAGAGLDALTDRERADFTDLNARYREKFGFPFIIAVAGMGKRDILAAFRRRLDSDADSEFAEACRQVEKIALIRLASMV